MDPLLVALVTLLVLVSIAGSFFLAVALMWLGVMIYDEITIYMKEPRLTRGQRIQQEIEWEKYLIDLKNYHDDRPLNVFRDRDGVRV